MSRSVMVQKPIPLCSGQGVTSINAEVSTRNVLGGVAKKESHGTHQVFRSAHLADRNKRGPLVPELRVFVKDLAGAAKEKTSVPEFPCSSTRSN